MADILPPAPIDAPFASYSWTDWYKKVRDAINTAGSVSWNQISSFSGSNLTDLETRNHNDLQNLQGGITDEYYHLTAAEKAAIGDSGWTYVVLSSDFTTSSTSSVDVTGLFFTPAASKKYIVEGEFLIQTNQTSVGVRPGITWSSGLADGVAKLEVTNSDTTSVIRNLNFGTSGNVAGTDLPAVNTSFPALVNATFLTGGSPSGNFKITLARD